MDGISRGGDGTEVDGVSQGGDGTEVDGISRGGDSAEVDGISWGSVLKALTTTFCNSATISNKLLLFPFFIISLMLSSCRCR